MKKVAKVVTEYFVVQWDKCGDCDGVGRLFDEAGRSRLCTNCGGTGGPKKNVPLAVALKAIVFKDLVGGAK